MNDAISVLNNEVLTILGLGIVDNKIYDYDKDKFVMFKGGNICTGDCLVFHKKDIKFDLLENIKLAEYFMNILFVKEEEDNGLYIQYFNIINSTESLYPLRSIEVNTNIGKYTTDFFHNYCLAIIHLIYIMTGTPLSFSLHELDFSKERLIQLYSKEG